MLLSLIVCIYGSGVDELLERSKRENMMLQAQIEALRTEVTLFRKAFLTFQLFSLFSG